MTAKRTAAPKFALAALIGCALLAWGAPQALAAAPVVTPGASTAVTDTTATLNGRVRSDVALTGCEFEYVTVEAFRVTGFTDLSSGGNEPCTPNAASIPLNTTTAVSAAIVRPTPGAPVVTRLVASSGDGSTAGSPMSIGFGLTFLDGEVLEYSGDPEVDGLTMTQAGDYPHRASITFLLTEAIPGGGATSNSTEDLRDAVSDLPAGVLGNPNGVPTCTEEQLQGGDTASGQASLGTTNCPVGSQVGVLNVFFNGSFSSPGLYKEFWSPLYLMHAPRGRALILGFNILSSLFHITGELVRDDSVPGSYRARAGTYNSPQTLPVGGATPLVWGVPADASHDTDRKFVGPAYLSCANSQPIPCSFPSPEPRRPFFSLPTSCIGPVETGFRVTGWQGAEYSASFLSHGDGGPGDLQGNTGCASLDFNPTLKAQPTTNAADSPTGLEVDLRIPQSDDPDGLATAHLRDTTVTLPEGLVINPSGANGLGACSPAQVDLDSIEPANCPNASKVATVQVDTPLLDHPVFGAAYIATPYDNPFNSLLALYITINDPQTGTVVKIPGEVTPDPVTGQLSSTFEENPQVPFENFRLTFFGGANGSLRTPATCGDYSTTSSLTPWSFPDSGPPATPQDDWTITQNPAGGPCATTPAEQPNVPSFDAGAISPIAGAHSPFVVNLRRDDGSQNFSAITVSPPQGLVAKLAGTAICPQSALDAAAAKKGNEERASPSCPAASEVGSVVGAAGAGPAPYYATGKAYIAGPYKGAPLSLATIIPATAGPFDLGTIVTRVAVHVNSKTAEITAVSDPIPHILQGIPLDVRSVQVALDRPNFSLNPTSCDPMAVRGLLTSTIGALANLESRFQLAECTGMGFKPKMTLNLRGGTKRGKHPALTVTLMPRPGDANIASVSVALPRSEFLENAHIRTVCTRPDFAADNCPAGAIYGESTVETPLLDYDLAGHVYLRSSDNLLPDVVPDLRGPAYQPIKLESSGRTDSIRGGIRNTIDFVPDAPFTKAVIALQGGSKGLLVNSRNICDRIYRATVRYTAHNGKTYVDHPPLRAKCGKRGKRGRRAKRAGHGRG